MGIQEDHPHAGGENFPREWEHFRRHGPSPRGWGEPALAATPIGRRRTIPTRVGRTPSSSSCPTRTPDHPHAGGENILPCPALGAELGPSPRGWGEPSGGAPKAQPIRTIPTRVGRTWPTARNSLASKDHPHAGGENYASMRWGDAPAGPSPRGWGELFARIRCQHGLRTIPTRVGRTSAELSLSAQQMDHPHAGGENASG